MEDVMIKDEHEDHEEDQLVEDPLAIVRVTSRCQLIDLDREETC